MNRPLWAILILVTAVTAFAQTGQYDLLLQAGHVIDARNKIDGVRDVAILDGKIALVAAHIDPAKAFKVVDARGYYVTPGLGRHSCACLRWHGRAAVLRRR